MVAFSPQPADGRSVPAATLEANDWDRLIADSGLPRHEARILAEAAGARSRSWLIAHGHDVPQAAQRARFEALAARARAGEPIAYLVGRREFWGRDFEVGPDVLIPREDTECLVALALALLPPQARVADLGTGSGCIAITLAAERPDLIVTATDRSHAALVVAASNAGHLLPAGQPLRLLDGHWYEALPTGERFDAVVSNPPYIAVDDDHLARGDLRHEPREALTDGSDGLSALRTLAQGAAGRLAPGGWLMLEHGRDQSAAVRALCAQAGLQSIATERDLSGNDRVTHARAPASD
jgi:release factor glutamine methyltransferase